MLRRALTAALAGAVVAAVVGLLVPAPAVARADAFRFIGGGRAPAFWWDGCARIDVGIDLRYAADVGMNPDWERVRWESVLSEVAFYSGYRFRLVEVRTEPGRTGPRVTGGVRGTDVVVTYGARRGPAQFRYPRLRSAGVQAYGGPQWFGRRAVSGSVVVNTPSIHGGFTDSRLAPKWAGVDPVRSVYMHEFGHVLGLDHVGDRRQLMYPFLDPSRDDALGPGERRALRILAGRPCHSPGRRDPTPPGTYAPDEAIMPIGDASGDPPERCARRGPCLPEPSPAPAPSPTPTAVTLPALTD